MIQTMFLPHNLIIYMHQLIEEISTSKRIKKQQQTFCIIKWWKSFFLFVKKDSKLITANYFKLSTVLRRNSIDSERTDYLKLSQMLTNSQHCRYNEVKEIFLCLKL